MKHMNTEKINEEIQDLLTKSGDSIRCKKVFDLALTLCKAEQITLTDVQALSLLSHLSAMVCRSITGERLAPIDQTLFSEISDESFAIAKKVKEFLIHLEEDEIYLLSIHFEVAKQNS
ncbi:PRD domain-containing protein [Bacillus massiliglaciei]|uniref:PRD domain-containing protein n=1 Tax=Bacillus massiliglaciei TaxID=1816693 RepID=UPI000DA63EB7|nr:PRD domain-containing protein [Bacillus massiliglaciei]